MKNHRTKTYRCARCCRRFRLDSPDAYQWNAVMRKGRVAYVLCPDCLTDGKGLNARANEAVFDYPRTCVADGRLHAPRRTGGAA